MHMVGGGGLSSAPQFPLSNTSTILSENEVVGTEDPAVGTSTDGVHGTGLRFYGSASDGRAQPLTKDIYKEESTSSSNH